MTREIAVRLHHSHGLDLLRVVGVDSLDSWPMTWAG